MDISQHSLFALFLPIPYWLSGKKILLPTQEMQETKVQSLGREDPLEKEKATPSRILAWRIPWTEETGGKVHEVTKELDTT